MIKFLKRILFLMFVALVGLAGYGWYAIMGTPPPDSITYGVSFNIPYTRELGLDWKPVYEAVLTDLGVKHLRLAAHWPLVEPREGVWNWKELDEELRLAREHGAEVTLAVGRRLPRWPECHVPDWAQEKSWEDQKTYIRTLIREVVGRYKDDPTIVRWQVENEPFLEVFANEHCGVLDVAFLEEEIALVRELDPSRQILLTDSGNLGKWYGAYKRGDLFGTSVYVYLWNEVTGEIRTVLPPAGYIVKRHLMELVYGKKDTLLIELSLEPWFDRSLRDVPVDEQTARMSIDRIDEVLKYAEDTRMDTQYLWGVEWWYWMREQGHPEYWEKARTIFGVD